jgi:pimeloyl-ACP methyl ester carboxylesterase
MSGERVAKIRPRAAAPITQHAAPNTGPIDGASVVNGLRLAWRAWHPDGKAVDPPVLLLHGLASAKRIWDLVAPLLAVRRRVVAVDQRGHGASDTPDDGYDIAQVVADDVALADVLALTRPVVVGHSWGGAVALALAATYPERVAGLVLVDGGVGDMQSRPGTSWEQVERDLRPPDFAGTPRAAFIERMRSRADLPWRPELEEIVLNIVALRSDGTVGPRLAWEHHRRILRSLWEFHPQEYFGRVTCPVAVILADRGQRNDPRAATFQEAKQRGADAAWAGFTQAAQKRILWYTETAHDIPLHRPEELAADIEAIAGETQ